MYNPARMRGVSKVRDKYVIKDTNGLTYDAVSPAGVPLNYKEERR